MSPQKTAANYSFSKRINMVTNSGRTAGVTMGQSKSQPGLVKIRSTQASNINANNSTSMHGSTATANNQSNSSNQVRRNQLDVGANKHPAK